LPSLTEAWQQSFEVLHRLAPLSSSATRCLAALELLNEEIVSEETNGFSTSGNVSRPEPAAITQYEPNLDSQDQANVSPTPISETLFTASTIQEQQYYPQQDEIQVGDAFGSMPELQDFTWLESLPVDLLSGGYEDLPQFYQGL